MGRHLFINKWIPKMIIRLETKWMIFNQKIKIRVKETKDKMITKILKDM